MAPEIDMGTYGVKNDPDGDYVAWVSRSANHLDPATEIWAIVTLPGTLADVPPISLYKPPTKLCSDFGLYFTYFDDTPHNLASLQTALSNQLYECEVPMGWLKFMVHAVTGPFLFPTKL